MLFAVTIPERLMIGQIKYAPSTTSFVRISITVGEKRSKEKYSRKLSEKETLSFCFVRIAYPKIKNANPEMAFAK